MEGGLRAKNIIKEPGADKPLLSIVTVVLNGEKYLTQTIQSVLNQNYPNTEYIIIDGGSKDKTVEIIRSFENKIDFWASERDHGIFEAMNKGIRLCRGEMIGILNSDDFYCENIFYEIVNTFNATGAEIVYGNMRIGEKSEKPDLSQMDKKPAIFHPACFVRKRIYDRIGLYDEAFKISSDYEFLLRCLRNNVRFHYLDKDFTVFRPGGMSSKCASNIEGYRIMKRHKTGHHQEVIWRGIKCYSKNFIKKILNLGR
jgi:glycosyltransferase involved in cell wall biosynthesis